MSNTKIIWQQLIKLLEDENVKDPDLKNISDGSLSPDHDRRIENLPSSINHTCMDIVRDFEQLVLEKEQLSEELLDCYRQLNAAFDATIAVSNCNTSHHAIELLLGEISRAVDCKYSYYIGPLATESSTLKNSKDKHQPTQDLIVQAYKADNIAEAQQYWVRNELSLQNLINQNSETGVAMIDYHRPHDLDHQGRGNVLAVRLKSRHDNLNSSSLILVRLADKSPFNAMEMNLAATVVRMGSAVMGNIIYAQKLNQNYLQTITSLVRATEAKDVYTSGHSQRVAELACKLGRHIELDNQQIKLLEWAGELHDIGKIGIKDDVLCKPGKLTDQEFDHIKTHPVKSFKVLEPIEALACIHAAVKHHHEHYDGSGYPDGLKGRDIPYHARILQIADVWDALTSTRPYRKAMSARRATEILRDEAGTTMDPDLVEKFLEIIPSLERNTSPD